MVAPFTGAWIEIGDQAQQGVGLRSLPSRERGLKFVGLDRQVVHVPVAPFTGAWIEIIGHAKHRIIGRSLPSRERGLKLTVQLGSINRQRRSLHGSVD